MLVTFPIFYLLTSVLKEVDLGMEYIAATDDASRRGIASLKEYLSLNNSHNDVTRLVS